MTASPAALRLAAAGANWMPSMLERIVQYAGDVGAAGQNTADPSARLS